MSNKATSAREIKAREIVNIASRARISLIQLDSVVPRLPALTDAECRAIAYNYPFSYGQVRRVFPANE